MAKLSKVESKAHLHALEMLEKGALTEEERYFVFDNYQEGAVNMNGLAGAFFTPRELANDLAVELTGFRGTVVDLCAGIGRLSRSVIDYGEPGSRKVTCVEMNASYYAAGKKLVPEAEWVNASIFDVKFPEPFDVAICNPPFGAIKTGRENDGLGGFEFSAIYLASKIAKSAVFILPQMSTPFEYSGKQCFEDLRGTAREPRKVASFRQKTCIEYEMNCGIDTSYALKLWHGVSPAVEIVTFEFAKPDGKEEPAQKSLFGIDYNAKKTEAA